jgi:hypothetical protein
MVAAVEQSLESRKNATVAIFVTPKETIPLPKARHFPPLDTRYVGAIDPSMSAIQ